MEITFDQSGKTPHAVTAEQIRIVREAFDGRLHVGAGTFLPVKAGNAAEHPMHTEHFEITLDALQGILEHIARG